MGEGEPRRGSSCEARACWLVERGGVFERHGAERPLPGCCSRPGELVEAVWAVESVQCQPNIHYCHLLEPATSDVQPRVIQTLHMDNFQCQQKSSSSRLLYPCQVARRVTYPPLHLLLCARDLQGLQVAPRKCHCQPRHGQSRMSSERCCEI